jgi:signal transduction histidine kinase
MNKRFWEEYIEASLELLKKAVYVGIFVLIYTFIPDFLNSSSKIWPFVLTTRGISVVYLIILVLLLKKETFSLKKTQNYYLFIYSIFLVILFTGLTVGFLTESLTTFYYFVVIELELFYAALTLTRIRVFSFFIIFANVVYFVFIYFSNESISSITISNFLSIILMAPLAIFIQYQILEHHKKEYLKRQKLSVEINKKEHAQIRLIEAKEIAEKANNAKSLFIANLSHEVRTPIHAIVNYSKMGGDRIDKLDKEKISHYFNQINTSTERLLKLVDELLDFSKLESNTTNYNYQSNNILTIIKKARLELKILADKKNIEINIKNSERKNIAYFDEDKIIQVILNVIANAIKFSPNNSTITIVVEHIKNNFILVKVIDEGIGIEKSELQTIFNDFIQGSRGIKDRKGTGLGLSISKRIILNHNGKIWASNNRESGVTIFFTLPKKA